MTDINEQVRARFREVTAQRDAKRAVSEPLRTARDNALAVIDAQATALRAEYDPQIAAAEEGLFELDLEIGRLARFLEGKTGEVGTSEDIKE